MSNQGILRLPAILLLLSSASCGSKPCNGVNTAGIVSPVTLNTPTNQRALSAFNLRFENGDHRLARLTVAGVGNRVTGRLQDDSPTDDRFSFQARFCTLTDRMLASASFRTVAGTCPNTACQVNFPGLGVETRLLLVGFDIILLGGGIHDQEIQAIAIMPREGESSVLVSFNGSETMGHDTPPRPFGFTIQYAVVRMDSVRVIPQQGEERVPDAAVQQFRMTAALGGDGESRYLSGFSFANFGLNSETHLEAIGVNLADGTAEFHDGDGGETVRWQVKYLVPNDG